MQRRQVVIGVLGMVLAAAAAHAAAPNQVTLFGQKYAVEVHKRDGTFAYGVKIALQGPDTDTTQKANLCFVQSADPSADRLFISAPIGTNTDGPTGDQLYLLTGADKNGLFNTTNSKATQYLGGNVDRVGGGRPVMVAWISDTDTGGVKKDRNLVVMNFTDTDKYRFYDFDTLSGGDYISDAVLEIQQPEEDESVADPGMPDGDFEATTLTPNGLLLVAGNGLADDNGDRTPEIGVMDPTKNAFFSVKTRLVDATKNAAVKVDPPTDLPQSLVRLPNSTDEYWLLTSQDAQGDDDNTTSETLYRLKITLPADLANAKPGDIKVDVLGKEDILATNLGSSPGGIFGFTLGRLGANGMPQIYMADWHGNLLTLTPTP